MLRTSLRPTLLAAAALSAALLLASRAPAQTTALTLPSTTPAGEPFTLCLEAPGNSLAFVLVAAGPGTTPTKYGTLCLDFPFTAIVPFFMPASGLLCFDCDLPCVAAYYDLTVHLQVVSMGPTDGMVGMSTCTSMTIEQGVACGGTGTHPGDFATWTMGGWGANCSGDNIACHLAEHFDSVFPTGLLLGDQDGLDGDEHTAILLTSASAVAAFLPEGQTPGTIGADMVDPVNCTSGVISGQLTAAVLNTAFDDAGLLDADKGQTAVHLGDLVFAGGVHDALLGMSVREVIEVSHRAISGELPAPVDVDGDTIGDVTLSDLSTALDRVNNGFHEGTVDAGWFALP